jgi:hypothetical protein
MHSPDQLVFLQPGDTGKDFQPPGPVQSGMGVLLTGHILLLVTQKLRNQISHLVPIVLGLS